MQNLTDAASRIAADNLRTAAESQLLSRVFEAANVPILFVKGLTLGRLAYGNPAIKSAVDGDVLIDPMDMSKAAACLENAGFKLIAPRHSLHRWHRSWKESVWYKSTTGVQIDLHTRLADNPRVIPGLSVYSPNQCVDIGSGITLPTLAEDELLTYLAVHGAAAGWFRLKWAADFAALLADRPANEVRHCLRRSRELGGGRTFGQALLLAHRLFSLLGADPELVGELESDRGTCGPVGLALKLIQRAPAEPTELFLGTLPIHRSQFAMLPGIGYKLEEVRRRVAQSLTRLTT